MTLTRHKWQTISSSLSHWEGVCVECGARTNNALLAAAHLDTCPGKPKETPETLAGKLRAAGYVPPTCPTQEHDESTKRFLEARENYLDHLRRKPTAADVAWEVLRRIAGPLWLLPFVFLTLAACITCARGAEVPDRIVAALVQVETGAKWRNIGDIIGKWKVGDDGEISHFQLSPAALAELGVTAKANRIARCPVLAESYARAYLAMCYEKRGNWRDALATYNKWSRYRSAQAQDYAARILNLAETL